MLDLHHSLSLGNLKLHQERFQLFYLDHSLLTMAIYMVVYIIMAALSLPGAAVMTLAGGALFGLWKGNHTCILCQYHRSHPCIPDFTVFFSGMQFKPDLKTSLTSSTRQ